MELFIYTLLGEISFLLNISNYLNFKYLFSITLRAKICDLFAYSSFHLTVLYNKQLIIFIFIYIYRHCPIFYKNTKFFKYFFNNLLSKYIKANYFSKSKTSQKILCQILTRNFLCQN